MRWRPPNDFQRSTQRDHNRERMSQVKTDDGLLSSTTKRDKALSSNKRIPRLLQQYVRGCRPNKTASARRAGERVADRLKGGHGAILRVIMRKLPELSLL